MTGRLVRRLRRPVCLVATAGLLAACGAPGLDVADLSREPILVPPVEAVELGRTSVDGGGGPGPAVTAAVEVAYGVDLSPEDAARAWVEAYGPRYDLTRPNPAGKVQVLGGNDDVGVSMAFGPSVVPIEGRPEDYRTPLAGTTVVTIVISGQEDSETGDH